MQFTKSRELFSESIQWMPGGVNSPVRAFQSVGGSPIFISHAKGSKLFDVDGNTFVDYVGGWGPTILGHAHPEVVNVITESASKGVCFGTPTEQETCLAKLLVGALPSVEQVRLVSSGTEACMAAIRLARGVTGRSKVLKFAGNYHGYYDSLLVKSGSGVATLGLPESPGIPEVFARETLVCEFNDTSAVEAIFSKYGKELACVILEPIVGNCGFIRPTLNFLKILREITTLHGALLVFDEVMTGFRVAWGGYQNCVDIAPDITTLGKVIGGGLPLAAYGARTELMQQIAPKGPIYQAGTLSGNPLAVAAGKKTIEMMSSPDIYKNLADKSASLMEGIKSSADRNGIPIQVDWEGGLFGIHFSETPIANYAEAAQRCNRELFRGFFHHMLQHGVYWAPSPFEAGFISVNHSQQDIALTIEAADKFFKGQK